MKKQEFLNELRTYLNVLQDEEQEDIIDEYSQHIEMKIENGLSEEEAIKDFGSIRELAGEILEAYHVKLGDEKEGKKKSRKKSLKEFRVSFPCIPSLECSVSKTGKKIGSYIRSFFGLWIKPFQKMGQMIDKKRINRECKKTGKQKRKWFVLPFIAKKTGNLVHGIFLCFFWFCRMIWNCGVLLLSVFSAFFGLVALFFLGALMVLWLQGYPLGGIVLGIMGAVFCFGSFSVLGSTFMIRKSCQEYPNKKAAEEIMSEEERENGE